MKKFFSLVLALVMALSLTTMAWGANPTTLPDAVDGVITLTSDVDLAAAFVVDGTSVKIEAPAPGYTIDASAVGDAFQATNGGTLTLGANVTITSSEPVLWANGGTIVVDGANITMASVTQALACAWDNGSNEGVITIKSGTIKFTGHAADPSDSGVAIVAEKGGTVNVEGGTVYSTNVSALCVKSPDSVINISGTANVYTEALDPAFVTVYGSMGQINVTGGTVGAGAGYALVSTGCEATVSGNATVEGVEAHESANAKVTVEGGNITGPVSEGTVGTVVITGGTFSTDVSDYVAGDAGFTNNGDGTYTVATKSANTATYDLYEGDGDLYLENVYRTKFAAKKLTSTQAGQVAGWDIEGTFYVEISKSEATNGDYYLTNHDKTSAILYLRKADNHGAYTLTGKTYSNFGDDYCGEWNMDPETTEMYVDAKGNFYFAGTQAYMLVGNNVVGVSPASDADFANYYIDHQLEGVYNAKDELVSVKCVVCGATGKYYDDAADAPMGAVVKTFGTGYYVLNKTAAKPSTDTKVESAETFDAGIAMYVGMSVMAAAGSAVVLKKKD